MLGGIFIAIIKTRKLDNTAKFFPLESKKYSNIFRITAELTEEINPDYLKRAVIQSLLQCPSFRVALKKGYFWDYFVYNEKAPIIHEENGYPCKIDAFIDNNDYLFQVTYKNNRINIDIYHSLTDGNNGLIFFRDILMRYIDITYSLTKKHPETKRNQNLHIEDGYVDNFSKKQKVKPLKKRKAFLIKGKELPLSEMNITHVMIEMDSLKSLTKEKKVTITEFLTAGLMEAIYQSVYNEQAKEKVLICIPINLKKYFPSNTMANFFSYTRIGSSISKKDFHDFSNVLEKVKKEFETKLKKSLVEEEMSSNVRLGENFFIGLIPLTLKRLIIRSSNSIFKRFSSTTLTNIGKIDLEEEYQTYIKNFYLMMAIDQTEKIKVSVCSYQNQLVFTFNSLFQERKIEEQFMEFLKQMNLPFTIK